MDFRFDKDASAATYLISEDYPARCNDTWTKTAVISHFVMMLTTAVGASKIVIAQASAGAKVCISHSYVAFPHLHVQPFIIRGMDNIRKRAPSGFELLENLSSQLYDCA